MNKITELLKAAPSRRQFLAGVGAAGATAMVVGCGSNTASNNPTTTPVTTGAPTAQVDLDVLNFALNLEYLEASFYLLAATGSGIPAASQGTSPGTVTGGSQVMFTSDQAVLAEYANEIAQDELNHVNYLRGAIASLGGTPVDMPNIDLTAGFAAVAGAAGITLQPFGGDVFQFLVGAFIFEDVGVTAYHGGATLLQSKAVLGAAASIHAVEAYHAAEIRTLIAGAAAQTGAPQTYLNDANAIIAVRAALSGSPNNLASGSETALSTSSIVAADPVNSIGFKRTTDQVLNIVYAGAGAGASAGGFFPNGLNGNIKTISAAAA